MKTPILKFITLVLLAISLVGCSEPVGPISDNNPIVKKSTSGICHKDGSTYYEQTKKFEPFDTLADCLDSGGKLPKK